MTITARTAPKIYAITRSECPEIVVCSRPDFSRNFWKHRTLFRMSTQAIMVRKDDRQSEHCLRKLVDKMFGGSVGTDVTQNFYDIIRPVGEPSMIGALISGIAAKN